MLILLLQYLLQSLALLRIKHYADGPDALALVCSGNVQVFDLIVRLDVGNSLSTLALLKHPQVIINAALHDILILLGVQRLEVDESMAHLGVLCAATSL